MTLADQLSDWVSSFEAQRLLGSVLGLFDGMSRHQVKIMLWTDNPIVDVLDDTLTALAKSGILERRRDGSDWQFRWSQVMGPDGTVQQFRAHMVPDVFN